MSNKNFIIKVLLFLIFFVVLTFDCYAADCTETDGGRYDYYNKGTCVSSTGAVRTDYCVDSTTVKEFFCWSDQLVYNEPGSETGYVCENGKLVEVPYCGNGNCDPGEDTSNCPFDCGVGSCTSDCDCDSASTCKDGYEKTSTSCQDTFTIGYCCCPVTTDTCDTPGHEACEPEYGENSDNCPDDCGVGSCTGDCYCDEFDGCDCDANDVGCEYGGLYIRTSTTCEGNFFNGNCCCLEEPFAGCGDDYCDEIEGENCENCPEDCACIPPEVCVDGVCVDDCTCGSWSTSDTDCDDWHCSNSCQKYYTRNCNPSGCADEGDCKTPSYGSCIYDNECDTTGSKSNACGCTKPCTRTISLPYTSDNNEKINGEESYCSDTLDNDCDGLIDHEDPDCAALYVDVIAVSNFYNKGVPVVLLNISNPFGLATGKLILSVLDEDGDLVDSCIQPISLTENKLFFGTAVKNAHFYQWAESMLLTDEEIYECQGGGMSNYMDDKCKHHNSSEESFVNSDETEFYSKYPGLLILENTPSYLPDSGFAGTAMPNCESLFRSLDFGFYDLTASLEVIP